MRAATRGMVVGLLGGLFGAISVATPGGPAWAAATDLVVFEAQGGDWREGQRLDGSQPLHLDAGEQVALIANNGRVIRLSGPYDDVPLSGGGADGSRLSKALEALVTGSGSTATMLGAHRALPGYEGEDGALAGGTSGNAAAVRTVGTPTLDLPEPWLVDVTRGGDRCVHGAGQSLVLWRPARDQAEPVALALGDGAWHGRTAWPPGYAKLATPEGLPRLDGARYEISVGESTVALTLHVIPDTVQTPPVLAAWMVEKGCQAQAVALLRAIDAAAP